MRKNKIDKPIKIIKSLKCIHVEFIVEVLGLKIIMEARIVFFLFFYVDRTMLGATDSSIVS